MLYYIVYYIILYHIILYIILYHIILYHIISYIYIMAPTRGHQSQPQDHGRFEGHWSSPHALGSRQATGNWLGTNPCTAVWRFHLLVAPFEIRQNEAAHLSDVSFTWHPPTLVSLPQVCCPKRGMCWFFVMGRWTAIVRLDARTGAKITFCAAAEALLQSFEVAAEWLPAWWWR